MKTERIAWSANGLLTLSLLGLVVYLIVINLMETEWVFVIIFGLLFIVLLAGLTIVKPNEARIVLLFGKYLGTLRHEGLTYTVPFTKRKKMSLKVKTTKTQCMLQLPSETILVQVVIFYKIVDTAKALFEVEQVERIIHLQSERALNKVLHDYDDQQLGIELKSIDVTEAFIAILRNSLAKYGIEVVDLYMVKN